MSQPLSNDPRPGLEERVQALEDALAIQNLKARYAELVDRRYHRGAARPAEEIAPIADEIAALFTEDAVWDGGAAMGRCEGRAAIAERMREPTLLFSWHFFLKPRIEVSGDRATARWDILSPCTTQDGRPHWMAGTEDDVYVREGGVWLHHQMKLGVVFLAPHETGWQKIFV
ncbi:MAG: nuclear transport factor 2 family protein [Myxococcota bacterium]|nr:nuclear transport factor 2 family protein [Myxococcota bacterium]